MVKIVNDNFSSSARHSKYTEISEVQRLANAFPPGVNSVDWDGNGVLTLCIKYFFLTIPKSKLHKIALRHVQQLYLSNAEQIYNFRLLQTNRIGAEKKV